MLVDFLEENLFGEHVNPLVVRLFAQVPWPFLQRMFAGEFGLITMGLTYAFALVLPIVGTFFLAFGLLEDSGYLPRLAIMSNRLFRLIGLNGKAILPMVLGLGCDTMATMTARILESRKERFIVTLLLALGVPCSAQLGVILGLANYISLAGLRADHRGRRRLDAARRLARLALRPRRALGLHLRDPAAAPAAAREHRDEDLAAHRLVPARGDPALPDRARSRSFSRPRAACSALLERGLAPLIQGWLSLPVETTKVFILGFLRRDYGAAGLFALATADPPALTRQPDRGRARP